MKSLALHPIAAGFVTLILMCCDWVLTILQERQRRAHYAEHYHSYPVNTIEGNPLLQSSIARGRLVNLRHFGVGLAVSAVVAGNLYYYPKQDHMLFLGFVWGLLLVVISMHLGNLIGYWVSQRGVHGKLFIHQRAGYLIQMGRYCGLSVLLIALAVCSQSEFIAGVAIAGVASALRQVLWLLKIPRIPEIDCPPETPAKLGSVESKGL